MERTAPYTSRSRLPLLRDFEAVSGPTYNGVELSFSPPHYLEKQMQSAQPNAQVRDLLLRDLLMEDLLGRKQAGWDQEAIRERIQGKVVMVTGAAGSIGSELCRQIASFCPCLLVGLDQAETPLFLLERELERRFPEPVFHAEIGNITRFEEVDRIMQEFQPSIVYHAAAYKHVPMMERQIFAALENNIFGTWHVARAAASLGVEYFVLISTDKAVRPSSVMGATKRVAELLIRALQQQTGTRFVAVRFGNVLGSSGSVVPIFKDQIAAGGPVTVTHPEMRRYFMTASEAAQLVLQAFVLGNGSEIFVLDMGEPVKIVDLARNLIVLSGLQPERDIKIEFTGVRPGEKLFEELNLQAENLVPTSHSRISSLVSSEDVDAKRIETFLQELQEAVSTRDARRTILLLKELVPDYDSASQLPQNALQVETDHGDAEERESPCRDSAEPLPAAL
jgi:FlaA1/EpsC-like NDP-sugar epimerase